MKLTNKDIKEAYPAIMRAAKYFNDRQTNSLSKEDLEDIVQDTMIRIIKSNIDRMDITNFIGLCLKNLSWARGDFFKKPHFKNKELLIDVDQTQVNLS